MIFWKRFVGDYRSKTSDLTLIEHGAYGALLDEYYATEGPLTSDTARLFRICGALSDEEQRAVLRVRDRFFRLGKDLLLHNDRADVQIAAERRHSRVQREKAETRWERQRQAELGLEEQSRRKTLENYEQNGSTKTSNTSGLDAGAHAPAMPPQPQPQQGRSKDLSGRAGPERAVLMARFERVWAAYPRKEGKGRAIAWWVKNKPDEDLTEIMVQAIGWQRASGRLRPDSREGRSLVPLPASWFNDRGWEDERPTGRNGSAPAQPADPQEAARRQAWLDDQAAWSEVQTAARLSATPRLSQRHAAALATIGGLEAVRGLRGVELEAKGRAFVKASQPVGGQR